MVGEEENNDHQKIPQKYTFSLPRSTAKEIKDFKHSKKDNVIKRLLEVKSSILRDIDRKIRNYDPSSLMWLCSIFLVDPVDLSKSPVLKKCEELYPRMLSFCARYICERACVIKSPSKNKISDICEYMNLVQFVSTYITLDSFYELMGAGFFKIVTLGNVNISKRRRNITIEYIPVRFDFIKYFNTFHNEPYRRFDSDNRDLNMYTRIIELPEYIKDLKEISLAMEEELGFGISELFNILSDSLRPLDVERVDYSSYLANPLISQYQSRGDKWLKAFKFLIFNSCDIGLNDIKVSKTRHQKKRLATHPFIIMDESIIFSRGLILSSQNRWAYYLLHGEFPVPPSVRKFKYPKLHKALEERRNSRGKEFEILCEKYLDDIGAVWGRTNKQGVKVGNTKFTGEIDALVFDKDNKVIWVLDFKDLFSDQNARSIFNDLDKIIKYFSQVERTASEVFKDIPGVIKYFVGEWCKKHKSKSEYRSFRDSYIEVQEWSIKTAVVVRNGSPGEFLSGYDTQVVHLDGLKDLLSI
jgi:hypothetical protein